jgi:hypothetical protein
MTRTPPCFVLEDERLKFFVWNQLERMIIACTFFRNGLDWRGKGGVRRLVISFLSIEVCN